MPQTFGHAPAEQVKAEVQDISNWRYALYRKQHLHCRYTTNRLIYPDSDSFLRFHLPQ